MDIEITLLESKFFEVYKSDSKQLYGVLRSLKEAFIEHRDRLQKMLEKTNTYSF